MASCTIWRNFSVPIQNKSLLLIAKIIASNEYKEEVQQIQSLIRNGKINEAALKKQQLPAFTPSATFNAKRLLTHMEQYSGFVHLDFDKLTPQQLDEAFKIIISIPCTFLCFRSPSGNGLKVFVDVNTGAEYHDIAYKQVQQFYEERLGIATDPKCKDITRLCFMSYDPELHINIHNKKFEVNLSEDANPSQPHFARPQQEPEENDWTEVLLECVRFTEQKKTYTEGSRNEFIYVFASNANRNGIPHKIALQFCLDRYDLSEKEIRSTLNSAYTHHANEFGKDAKSAMLQDQPSEDYLKNTSIIPEELYLQMPDIIHQGAMAFSQVRERDVFLTAALAILSGCLPGVKGVYAGQEVFPNLFSFVLAPAASGKGAMTFAKNLADVYHQSVVLASKDAEAQFKIELAEHKAREKAKNKKDTSIEEPPARPLFKVIYIPANTSYAKIVFHLEQNGGFGIICETEADTMGYVFKQDWGNYSDMLRKTFHHERISISRKINNEFIEVNNPCLSVALTGTPGQVKGLIASTEDGLFSRFLFYVFKAEVFWKDVSPSANTVNLTEHFKKLSERVFAMATFLETEETIIELRPEQWKQLNTTCEAWLQDITLFTAEEAASIVKRLGLIIYRMTMIFTAMRKFEIGELYLTKSGLRKICWKELKLFCHEIFEFMPVLLYVS